MIIIEVQKFMHFHTFTGIMVKIIRSTANLNQTTTIPTRILVVQHH